MAIKKMIWCDECGKEFPNEETAKLHEGENCVPWKAGDRVDFPYVLMRFPGTIDRLGNPVGPGEARVAYIRSDEQVGEPDGRAITGYDFFAPISELKAL